MSVIVIGAGFGGIAAAIEFRRQHTFGACRRSGGGSCSSHCESLTLALRHPRTVGRLLHLRSALFMRWQLRESELRRERTRELDPAEFRLARAPARAAV